MKRIKKYIYLIFQFTIFFVTICAIFISYSYPEESNLESIPNVIILVWNGVSFSETMGDETGQYIPHMKNDLLPEGTLFINMCDENYPFHTPSVASIITGNRYEDYYSSWYDVLTKQPTIFQYARKKYNGPAYRYWEVGSFGSVVAYCDNRKEDFGPDTYPCILRYDMVVPFGDNSQLLMNYADKILPKELRDILTPEEIEFFNKTDPGTFLMHMWDARGAVYFNLFKRIFRRYKPKIIVYSLMQIEIAHSSHWAKYVAALKRVDEITWEIWKMIQEDPTYRNNTYLIVTPDVERNKYIHHHTQSYVGNPAHVWAYIYGPGINKGKIIARKTWHQDICTTVAYIMKFDATYSEGSILEEAFTDFQKEKK